MTEYRLPTGSTTAVRINGRPVGGISRAVIAKNCEPHDILEFLTDIPVSRVFKTTYEIKLFANEEALKELEQKQTLDELAFESGGKTQKYLNCALKGLQATVDPEKEYEYEITVLCSEREDL